MLNLRHPFKWLRDVFGLTSIVIIVLLFLLSKLPVLSCPFFWDELGVYGRMAFHLADTGPSLRPEAVDQWLSRGHPLLYPFIVSVSCKWFGTSVFVAHFANLLIAIALILSVFFHVSRLYDNIAGVTCVSLLIVQPIFFAQSAMVLPEVALTLALWWTAWAYYHRSILLYLIAGSAAVLIKEPAIVWICTLALFDLILNRCKLSLRWLLWLTPLIAFGVFLLFQKRAWGYYLFPYHSNGFDFNVDTVTHKLLLYLKFLFWDQGRWSLLFALIVLLYFRIIKSSQSQKPDHLRAPALVLTVCGVYLLFSSLTFQAWRYLIPIMPLVVCFIGIGIWWLYRQKMVWLATVIYLGCFIIPISHLTSDKFECDNDMSYLRTIEAEKLALQYMIDNGIYRRDKFSVNMPLNYAIMDHRFGYLPDSVDIYHSRQISSQTEYAVALTPGTSLENPDNFHLTLVHECYYYDIKLSVYRVLGSTGQE